MRIDLHTHSHLSDGTDAPEELIAAAARTGLDVVALTDHDTTAGWDRARAAAGEHGIAFVGGMELSCRAGGTSVHLLSYLHDPHDEALHAEAEATRQSRLHRARRMVDRLNEDFPITWTDVEARTEPGSTVGRPHIADALVELGVVPTRSAAFATILSARGRYYVPHHAPDAVRAVELVRSAGGVPVIAHPGASQRGSVVPEPVIRAMVDAGLAGLEVDHRDHTRSQREHLRTLAHSLGLLVTGSSDYHGAGKPNRLGEHTSAPEVLAAIEGQGRGKVEWP